MVELVDFMEFKLGFHGHVGPCRICRLGSDTFLVVYMCCWVANFVLQVAPCLFLCLFCFFGWFRILVENEFNLLSPTTST